MKAFLICPVRGVDPGRSETYTTELEAQGWSVHFPARDTDQDDESGFRICRDNLRAIKAADRVFIVWDGNSQGCLFDAGMAFALGKSLTVLEVPELLGRKSFQDMLTHWGNRDADD